MKNDFDRAIRRNKNANQNLSESTIKLYSLINAGAGVLDVYKKYEALSNKVDINLCILKQNLIDQIRAVELKYKLPNSIKIDITYPSFQNQHKFSGLKINNYEVQLQFRTKDFIEFVAVARDLFNIMPQSSMILSLKAEYVKVLGNELINSLSPNVVQNLIYANMYLRIRALLINNHF